MKPLLRVGGSLTESGIAIRVNRRDFRVTYPKAVWSALPQDLKQAMLEHLTYGNTHYLPLILDKGGVAYDTPHPVLESALFMNQLYDMTCCEHADGAAHLSYVRDFYNLDFTFAPGNGAFPQLTDARWPKTKRPAAVLPFTFGKESLVTFALARELGIDPILMYEQEPVHGYEEAFKTRQLPVFSKRFNVPTYFVKNDPGLFRYGAAFKKKEGTEIGWGSQITLLALLSVPFAYAHHAQYVLIGSEYLNNEFVFHKGWKVFSSYDQSSAWTLQKSDMVRFLTDGRCEVKTSLEPMEEISIFSMLHRRYPEIGRFQFSCGGQYPLYGGTQWCHRCYKCVRMYLFARCCNVDPASIGFKKDLLKDAAALGHYFGTEYKTGATQDLDFAFYFLYKKKDPSPLIPLFVKQKLPHLKPWSWYKAYYTRLQPEVNLPPDYRAKMRAIFTEELNHFSKLLP